MSQTIKATGNPSSYLVTLDDDPVVGPLIEKVLGLRNRSFTDANELLDACGSLNPIAAFIDIHLGENRSGLKLVPKLREKWPFCPILVITADPSDEAVSEALACGADDFIRKPIRPKELTARLQIRLVDQAQKEAKHRVTYGDVELNLSTRAMRGPKAERYLSPTEVSLFMALHQAKGITVPRKTLKVRCWDQISVSDNALDRKVYELRRALSEIGSSVTIGTSYGAGFYLESNKSRDELAEPQRA